jgi:hypothetical protein
MATALNPTDFARVMMLSKDARADLLEFFGSTEVQPAEITQLIKRTATQQTQPELSEN